MKTGTRYLTSPGYLISCVIMALMVGSYAAMLGSFPMALVETGTLPATIGVIIAGYSVGAVACRLIFSVWIDRVPWQFPISLGALVMAVSCYLLDPELEPAYQFALRTTFGIGFGAASAATYASVTARAPRDRRGLAIGVFTAAAGLAIVTMPALGVILFSHGGFTPVVWLSTAMAAAAAVMGLTVRGSSEQVASRGEFRPDWTMGLLIVSVGLCAVPMGAIEATIPFIAKAEDISGLPLIYAVFGLSLVVGRAAGGALGDRMSRGRLVAYGLLAAGFSQVLAILFLNEYTLILSALLGGGGMGTAATNLNTMLSLHVPDTAQGRALSWSGLSYDVLFAAGAALGGAVVLSSSAAPFMVATGSVLAVAILASAAISRMVPVKSMAGGGNT